MKKDSEPWSRGGDGSGNATGKVVAAAVVMLVMEENSLSPFIRIQYCVYGIFHLLQQCFFVRSILSDC